MLSTCFVNTEIHSEVLIYIEILQRNISGANQMVHQGSGMGGIGNAYVGSAIYNAQANTHSVQPVIASTPICNLGDTAQILSSTPTLSNITFRKLPFYKLKHEVLRPAVLSKLLLFIYKLAHDVLRNDFVTLPVCAGSRCQQSFIVAC